MAKSHKKQEALIKKAVEKYGKGKVLKVLAELGMVQPDSDGISTFTACETGYYWSESLQRCVLDIGEQPGDPDA